MDTKHVSDWLQLPAKYLFLPVAILSSLILILPANALGFFGLDSIVASKRMWIGSAALLSYSFLLVRAFSWALQKSNPLVTLILTRRQRAKVLLNLSPGEKALLAQYLLDNTKTQVRSICCGITRGLEHNGVIYRATDMGDLDEFAFNLQPWAWRELREHPELLEPEYSAIRQEYQATAQY